MTTKEVFLRRLRTSAGPGAPPPHRPLAAVDRPPEVRPVWPDPTASMVDRWIRSFEGLGGHVHRTTAERVGATIADVDGPDEVHVVVLDNGRSRILGSAFQEALHCIRCGACLNACPVYRQVGGHAYGSVYAGPPGPPGGAAA